MLKRKVADDSTFENDEIKNFLIGLKNKRIKDPQYKITIYTSLIKRILENVLQKEKNNESWFYVRFLMATLPKKENENECFNELIHDIIIITLPSTISEKYLLNSERSCIANIDYHTLITEPVRLMIDCTQIPHNDKSLLILGTMNLPQYPNWDKLPLIVKDVDNIKSTIKFFDEFPIISIQKCEMNKDQTKLSNGEKEWIFYLYDELKSSDTELISIKNGKDHLSVWNKSIEMINSIKWK